MHLTLPSNLCDWLSEQWGGHALMGYRMSSAESLGGLQRHTERLPTLCQHVLSSSYNTSFKKKKSKQTGPKDDSHHEHLINLLIIFTIK